MGTSYTQTMHEDANGIRHVSIGQTRATKQEWITPTAMWERQISTGLYLPPGVEADDSDIGKPRMANPDLEALIGALDDAIVDAGATGSVAAKLRRLTTDLDALNTLVDTLGTEATLQAILDWVDGTDTTSTPNVTLSGSIVSDTIINHLANIESAIVDTSVIVDYSDSPGGKVLRAGNKNAGFLGFVPSSEFITGTELALALGITAGSAINSDTPWIKYIYRGKVCFTPLKPLRHSISWNDIYNAGAIYDSNDEGMLPPNGRLGTGLSIDATDNSINTTTQRFAGDLSSNDDYADTVSNVGDVVVLKGWSNEENNGEFTVESITNEKIVLSGGVLISETGGKTSRIYPKANEVTQNATVAIRGLNYTVRAFRGAANNPLDSYNDSDRGSIGDDNEWNQIILPLHERARLQNWNYPQYAGSTEDHGIYLTNEDFVLHYTLGAGSVTWCQEVSDVTSWTRAFRGNSGASLSYVYPSWYENSFRGFRPVLELPQTSIL